MWLAAFYFLTLTQGLVSSEAPPSHWASKAIDELSALGILRGYPDHQPPFKLERVSYDYAWLTERNRRWRAVGVLDNEWCIAFPSSGREQSAFELAVDVHATWLRVQEVLLKPGGPASNASSNLRTIALNAIPDIARATGMLAEELRQLGADPSAMVEALQRVGTKSTSAK